MQCHRMTIVLLAIFIGASGCANSDHRASPGMSKDLYPANRRGWESAPKYAASSVRDAKAPKILPETHFAAGKLFESQGMIGKAIHQYRRAIAVNHHYAEAYDRLGRLLSMTGLRDEALAALRKAVELRPKSATMRNNLGFELLLAHRWAEAEYELSQAIRIMPDFTRAYINLGIAQSKVGKFNNALASFRAVLPEADAYYNVGLMYRSQQRIEEAAEAFRRAVSIDERFVAAKKQLEELAESSTRSESHTLVRHAQREGVAGQETVPALLGVTNATGRGASTMSARNVHSDYGETSRAGSTRAGESWSATLARLDKVLNPQIQRSYRDRTAARAEGLGRGGGMGDRETGTHIIASSAAEAYEDIIAMLENEVNCVEERLLDETLDATLVDAGLDRGYSSPADPDVIARALATPVSAIDIHDDNTTNFCSVSIAEYFELCPAEAGPVEASWPDSMDRLYMESEQVSSVYPEGLLRELELQLGVARNEIECLATDARHSLGSGGQSMVRQDELSISRPGSSSDAIMGPPVLAMPMNRGAQRRTGDDESALDLQGIIDLLEQDSSGDSRPDAMRPGKKGRSSRMEGSRGRDGAKIPGSSTGSRWMFDQVDGLFGITRDAFLRWQQAVASGETWSVQGPNVEVARQTPSWPFVPFDAASRADSGGPDDYRGTTDVDMP